MESVLATAGREPWNKGSSSARKRPSSWAIQVHLQMQERLRELALLDLGIDSKLRACDLVRLRVRDVCHGERVAARAMVLQQKTQRPVQFEITPPTRDALLAWIKRAGLKSQNFLFSVAWASRHTLARGSTPESSIIGFRRSDPIRRRMEGIQSGAPKHRLFTAGPRIFEQFSFCSDTRKSKARCVISESRWTTR